MNSPNPTSASVPSKNYTARKRIYATLLLGWMVIGAVAFALSLIFAK